MVYRALTEIDEVIGDSTLIEKGHIDRLEYIQAVSLCHCIVVNLIKIVSAKCVIIMKSKLNLEYAINI